MRYHVQIAGLVIEIDTDQKLFQTDQFIPFLIGETASDFRAVFRQVDQLPPIPEQILHEDLSYRVHPDGKGGYIRTFFDAPRDFTAYAVATYDYSGGFIRVEYLENGAHCVSELRNTFFHLGLETLLIHRNRLCLHAACVDTAMGGILFSGPSGIGKSTQAELWCRYRGAKQINGDRPILEKSQTGWRAWGSPYAGSSRCHVNESCSVRAIVMVEQARTCGLRRLRTAEAFRLVWSGLTANGWNRQCMEMACDLAIALVNTVPVFVLSCTPDEQAVETLEWGLRKELDL